MRRSAQLVVFMCAQHLRKQRPETLLLVLIGRPEIRLYEPQPKQSLRSLENTNSSFIVIRSRCADQSNLSRFRALR
jgi:hypothetical protein